MEILVNFGDRLLKIVDRINLQFESNFVENLRSIMDKIPVLLSVEIDWKF